MFRKMRRFKQQLTNEECIAIMKNENYGVLALYGDEGYPYSVPVNYVYSNGKIYFHSAKSGHKVYAALNNEKVSFCIVGKSEVVPEEYTCFYKSVIIFGKIKRIEEVEAITSALYKEAGNFRPGFEKEREKVINRELPNVAVFEITVEHMTGKQSMNFVKDNM